MWQLYYAPGKFSSIIISRIVDTVSNSSRQNNVVYELYVIYRQRVCMVAQPVQRLLMKSTEQGIAVCNIQHVSQEMRLGLPNSVLHYRENKEEEGS